MEDHCTPLSLAYFYQDEGIEELRHCLVYITELEATVFSAKEEIKKREIEIINLKDVLNKTIKQRNEAQQESQNLILDKLVLQQQLKEEQQQQQDTLNPPISGTCSSEEESDFNNHITISSSKFNNPLLAAEPEIFRKVPHCRIFNRQQSGELDDDEVMVKLAADRELPKNGKFLQAVKEAGPLLQTLLLAGPLPQWQHPPPQLDSVEIPPVTISAPATANHRLIHQDSFNSYSTPCLSKKRGERSPDSCYSPISKYQKISLH
ncbi:uncharacterized protein LOC126660824 [Mercurialis annua]|uniref:uncharacterized protein LOC126660824 n=1 Tax=Mercurialis annua TaxID=3986 RepID=UPI00215E9F71|nr:uncharacterized protein LOC126660824 [Mercurialis annua]